MTNAEILCKAIENATKNGFVVDNYPTPVLRYNYPIDWYLAIMTDTYYLIIFSHSFAKAFWGKELVCKICGTPKSEKQSIASCDGCLTPILSEQDEKYYYIYKWQRHLQQMVLCENPLQYLENFL